MSKENNVIFLNIPTCSVEGCNKKCMSDGLKRDKITRKYKKICRDHHYERYDMLPVHQRYRKTYCENIDGRLGFKCTTTICWQGMLDVDHIDENPSNNDPSNFQTLCSCCHEYKTHLFNKLYGRTPGRKTLGLKY
jgi:hypothetical protein